MKRLVVVVVGHKKQSYFNSTGDSKNLCTKNFVFDCPVHQALCIYMCVVLVSVTLVTQTLRDDLPLWSQ